MRASVAFGLGRALVYSPGAPSSWMRWCGSWTPAATSRPPGFGLRLQPNRSEKLDERILRWYFLTGENDFYERNHWLCNIARTVASRRIWTYVPQLGFQDGTLATEQRGVIGRP